MNAKGVHRIADMFGGPNLQAGLPDGRWVQAVAEPYPGLYFRAAWEVLRGRAVAVQWPKPGDLERAIYGSRGDQP